jgi:predicted RNA-binding protein with TRAM domain
MRQNGAGKMAKSGATDQEKPFKRKTSTSKASRRAELRPKRAETAEDIRAGDLMVVTIKRIGINGEGVGYYKRKAVFVPGALPGEVVKAKAVLVEPTYISAALA